MEDEQSSEEGGDHELNPEEVESNTDTEEEGQGGGADNLPDLNEDVTIEDVSEDEYEDNAMVNLPNIPRKFPTRGKYIKFRRQAASTIEQDSHIPTDRFLYAQITNKLKADKFGRVYFNIRFPNNNTDGIYLTLKNLKRNDFIWDIVEQNEFLQQEEEEEDILQHRPINQTDGVTITPESMTPDSSPTLTPLDIGINQILVANNNLEWDHSPERLAEDNAFLWEDEPLNALTAADILKYEPFHDYADKEEENIKSPLGVFRRQRALRRKKTSNTGYASQSVNQPSLPHLVQLEEVSNLSSVLLNRRPLIPEVVALDESQLLDIVLPPDGTENEFY